MSKMRTLIAIIAAGIAGTLLNAVAVAVAVSPAKLSLALVPGRYLVSIALCLVLPILSRFFSGLPFYLAAIVLLTGGASLLAKLVFAAAAPWVLVLSFNCVFAVAAALTYRALTVWLSARGDASASHHGITG